ncbi:MAG: vegetatible incompatibility protein HET-E-1 [Pirellulaceae bacterium]|nr:MAG: vegetatible incompatibility protein HET-E-1 [Pirellulaceae bacterium]
MFFSSSYLIARRRGFGVGLTMVTVFWSVAMILVWWEATISLGRADDRAPAEGPTSVAGETVSYARDVEPIFRTRCQGCHQAAKAHGGYVMTDFERLVAPGESGEPAIVAGDPAASYLVQQIEVVDGEAAMPKQGPPLTAAEIDRIKRWIAQGAINDLPPRRNAHDSDHPPVYTRPPVVTAVAFSPDGKWLAVSGFHEVLLVSTADWQTKHRLIGLSERIESISFSPDSRQVAVTGGSPGRMGEIQIWNVDNGELALSQQVSFDTVYGGCFSPDGKIVAFGCADNTVRAIDAQTGKSVLHQGAHEDWVLACAFNPSGTHVVSAGRDRTVKLTEVATERFVDNITSITPGALSGGINALAMHPTRDEVLVGGADGTPKVYRLFRETERRIGDDANLIRKFPPMPGRIFDVDISRDGQRLVAAATLDGHSQIVVYPYDFNGQLPEDVKKAMAKRIADRNDAEKKLIAEYTSQTSPPEAVVDLPQTGIYAVAFSADGQQVAVSGSDGVVRILSASQQWQPIREFVPVAVVPSEGERQTSPVELAFGDGLPLPSTALPSARREREVLPRTKMIELSVYPDRVVLDGNSSYVQLVVQASYADGIAADVTRLAQVAAGSDCIDVSASGLVVARRDGQTELQIEFGGREIVVPVRVDRAAVGSPDFVRDVNPILTRLGCNSGTCHGAQQGKNGFKLSLRGYDPVEDVRALSDDLAMRRLRPAQPDSSLMLLKPIGGVPHEGGVLLSPNSVYYKILRDWIAAGAPLQDQSPKPIRVELFPRNPVLGSTESWQQFRVVAEYPDGSRRDVTHESFLESGNSEICVSHPGGRVQGLRRGEAPILVRYEGAYAASTLTVMGDREGFVWTPPPVYNHIDELVAAKWQRMKILPSEVCNDAEFLRRVRLDLTGLPPSVEELREFLSDPKPSRLKRQEKIDALLGSPAYVEHWTNKWADLLQVNSKYLGKPGAAALRAWIREAIAENRPYDQFVRDILTASGSNRENPPASYFKILRTPDLMMENTTHLFLAVRFNCNKCHDHPFERWTQDQYYQLSAFFAQTALRQDPASGDKKIGGTAVEGAKPLYEEVYDRSEGEMMHPRRGQPVAPEFPFECEYTSPPDATRRQQLAAWLTSPDNPYFARSYVNRLWGYLTGTGLMEPLDDLRAGNPPTNPELLDYLTGEFIDSGFDVEHVLRLICNSRTYQLSVATNGWNEDDALNYSHAKARRLPAEVLYDAIYFVTGAVSTIPGVAPGTRAAELVDAADGLPDGFLKNLGRPPRESACECERSQDLQLGPVMALISGPTVGAAISDPQCSLAQLARAELSDHDLVREIYLRVLCREPSDEEIAAVLEVAQQIDADHQELVAQLQEREAWWKAERQRREEQRLAELASVREAIAARQKEIAPERKRLEEERQQRIAQAQQAMEDYAARWPEVANQYLDQQADVDWIPLSIVRADASNKDMLLPQPDRSIRVSGKGEKGHYTVVYRTAVPGITGFRLEALPVEDLDGGGPGLPSNGNFVVTEIEAFAYPVGAEDQRKQLKIRAARADFSQSGFAPEQVFDGKLKDQRGWAVHPRGGVVHWLVFDLAEPIGVAAPVVIEFKIHQHHNAGAHRLARFRLSATVREGEIPLGLPEDFAALRATPTSARAEQRLAPLVAYLKKSDARWLELEAALAEARQPVPPDAELVGLQTKAKLLEVETPEDPALVQLRKDVEQSARQLENRRLTIAQDLTWALINSPAFLFNH